MTFLAVHVWISLVGIASGSVVVGGLLKGRRLDGWTVIFLTTTAATSATGFLVPADRLLPSHVVGLVSLIVLAIAVAARYARHLAGPWRPAYVISAVIALYLNVFVGVVQAFLKVSALAAAAPTHSERPFLATQLVVLFVFAAIASAAVSRFHSEPTHPPSVATTL
jgi:hypothetical protein